MKKIFLALSFIPVVIMAQTQLIAHRGFWNLEKSIPQNSIAALRNAATLPLYGSEFDVRMSKDGYLIVNHDETFDGKEIAQESLQDLKSLQLSNSEKLPTLSYYLSEGSKFKHLKLIVELKPAKSEELENIMVRKAVDEIVAQKMEDQVEFISFSLHVCKTLKKDFPQFKVHYLNGDLAPKQLKELNIDGLDYHYSVLLHKNPNWIEEAKELGLKTNTWTVDDPEIAKTLKQMGIDFITTNRPDIL